MIGFDALFQDVRFGSRSLARQRGLTAAAVATLALGIGALTALASVVRSVLLEPLPYRDSPALVQLWETRERVGRLRGHVSPASFLAVSLLLTLLSLVAGYLPARRATRVDPIEALHQD